MTSYVSILFSVTSWVVASYASHYCSRAFLLLYAPASCQTPVIAYPFLLLTLAQVSVYYFTTRWKHADLPQATSYERKMLFASLLCHTLATMTTNISFIFMDSSMTLVIKMLEPLTSAVTCRLITGESPGCSHVIALFVAVVGATGFVHRSWDVRVGTGTIAALISNGFYGLRNIILKHAKETSCSDTSPKKRHTNIPAMATAFLSLTALTGFRSSWVRFDWGGFYVISSAVCHGVYAYISTRVLLHHLPIVGHALAGVIKRVLVVLIFLLVRPGPDATGMTSRHVICLALCTSGLVMYTRGVMITKRRSRSESGEEGTPRKLEGFGRVLLVAGLMSASLVLLGAAASFNPSPQLDTISTAQARWVAIVNEADNLRGNRISQSETIEYYRKQQRMVFREALANRKHVMLYGMMEHGNKQEAMLTVGLMNTLAELHVNVEHMCGHDQCPDDVTPWRSSFDEHSGNMNLILRAKSVNHMMVTVTKFCRDIPDMPIAVLLSPLPAHEISHRLNVNHTCRNHVSVIFHGHESIQSLRNVFKFKYNIYFAPHLGFAVGAVESIMPPVNHVTWLLPRKQSSTCNDPLLIDLAAENDRAPLICMKRDIDMDWPTPKVTTMIENAHVMTYSSLLLLSTGQTLVVDRLSGHLGAVLLDKPHVVLLSRDKELRAHWGMWGRMRNDTRAWAANDHKEAMTLVAHIWKNSHLEELSTAIQSVDHLWY